MKKISILVRNVPLNVVNKFRKQARDRGFTQGAWFKEIVDNLLSSDIK